MEVRKCRRSPLYFIDTYCQVLSEDEQGWIPLSLWPAQMDMVRALKGNRLVVALKARQLGMTWLVLAFVLWLVLFHPIATVLLFSRRDDEAVDLLRTRLKGMHSRLPPWLRARTSGPNNDHEWSLANGSRVKAFPANAGDSYTASFVFIDEADLVPDLGRLMRAVKPTIDAGGKLVLLSRADKGNPQSLFKRTYTAAKQKLSDWAHLFIPWSARPGRDATWYEAQKRDVLARTGALDDLHEQYPASDTEALAPRSLDKRIPAEWLQQCYEERPGLDAASLPHGAPSVPGLTVYALPRMGAAYVIGVDPAEGNPTSDDSALTVLDAAGEEVTSLAGRFQPAVFAAHADALGRWYNGAGVLVERNNHGHAVLLWLADNSRLARLSGYDGKDGWLSNSKGKAILYDACADAFREKTTVLHSFATFVQLASIEGATLRAPEGEMDDRADGYALAVLALANRQEVRPPVSSPARPAYAPPAHYQGPAGPFRPR